MAYKSRAVKLNERIERMSELIYFVQVKLTMVALILPAVFITLVNHFVFDLNENSYFMPIPVVYVQ